MRCPAVIDVLVPSGPVVVEVVTPGPPGAIGSRWFTGAGVPAADLGAVGDYYLRANGDVYGPKASGGWGAVQFTLTGGASLSDATPQSLGTAAAGTATTASRGDHRHAMPTAAQVGADPAGTAAAAVSAAATSYATATQGTRADSAVQPGDLSAVATSGAYADLGGRPTLPNGALVGVHLCGGCRLPWVH